MPSWTGCYLVSIPILSVGLWIQVDRTHVADSGEFDVVRGVWPQGPGVVHRRGGGQVSIKVGRIRFPGRIRPWLWWCVNSVSTLPTQSHWLYSPDVGYRVFPSGPISSYWID